MASDIPLSGIAGGSCIEFYDKAAARGDCKWETLNQVDPELHDQSRGPREKGKCLFTCWTRQVQDAKFVGLIEVFQFLENAQLTCLCKSSSPVRFLKSIHYTSKPWRSW